MDNQIEKRVCGGPKSAVVPAGVGKLESNKEQYPFSTGGNIVSFVIHDTADHFSLRQEFS